MYRKCLLMSSLDMENLAHDCTISGQLWNEALGVAFTELYSSTQLFPPDLILFPLILDANHDNTRRLLFSMKTEIIIDFFH